MTRNAESATGLGYDSLCCRLYAEQPTPIDQLPYTEEFDDLHADFVIESHFQISKIRFWRMLIGLRKNGKLPKKSGRGK